MNTGPLNQIDRVSRTPQIFRVAVAAASGLLSSLAFAPAEWSWIAWVGLVPLLVVALPARRAAWRLGLVFGMVACMSGMAWLRELQWPALFGVALIYAWIPACWLKLAQQIWLNVRLSPAEDLKPQTDSLVRVHPRFFPGRSCFLAVSLALCWCGSELIRGLFAPWNNIGVSQWQNGWLLPLTRVTGVDGISFLIVLTNVAVYIAVVSWFAGRDTAERFADYWRLTDAKRLVFSPLLLAVLLIVVAGLLAPRYDLPPPGSTLRIAAVQGNIPQIRRFSKTQLAEAMSVYDELTLDIVAREQPDLVVWPETALPVTLRGRAHDYMAEIFEQTGTPLLAGTIDRRLPYDPGEGEAFDYNSALLYDASGKVVNWYDKMHLVPFGEYVPFDRYLPFLVEWIGMGRNLTPGTEYTVMPFGDSARFGINICFEDVFSEISRNSVLRGANVLIVITNDAWFGKTSASRQHLAHSVLRAVETCRPLLRNGNNTDTCLILPDGRIESLLYGRDTRFIRDARVYDVPVWEQLPLTFYTRHGDWFALVSGTATILLVLWCLFRFLFRRQRLAEMVQRPE